ncbi:nucleoside triphosphate pyrophosphatase [Luteococcus sp. H138]|uniref:Maf family protein n=1 Tax=unclassified Luteococcus TaxID=2639923 RepID=UPI00313DF564
MRFILASSSPARLSTLARAGIRAEVIRPDVDESAVRAATPSQLTAELARLKAAAVLDRLEGQSGFALVACDSMLELDGRAWGKPEKPQAAVERWRAIRGRTATLRTGHHVVVADERGRREVNRVGSTSVTFADLDDAEIDAYVATGEPTRVAGAFAIDGMGGAFVTGITGDYHNVVGISLPLVRQMLLDLGVGWYQLWG